MDNQRLILFAVLAALILMLWSAWEAEHRPAPVPVTKSETPATPGTPSVPAAPGSSAPQAVPSAIAQLENGERIQVTTDVLQVEIDTVGGDLRQLDLRRHPVSADQPNKPFRLFTDQGKEVFVSQSGLIARDTQLPYHKTRYSAEASRYELATGQNALTVRLTWSGPDGLRVAKIYTFHRNDYRVDLNYEVTNTGRKPREVYLYAQFLRAHVDVGYGLTTLPTYTGGVIYTAEKRYEKIDFDHIRNKQLARDAEGGWVAMLQHYFLGAWLPAAKDKIQFYSEAQSGNQYVIGYKTLSPTLVAPGAKATLSTHLYAGPKEHARLEKLSEGMTLTVDYGWLTVIAAPLFWLLAWLHKLVGNWGWAIVLLTVLIKLVFYHCRAPVIAPWHTCAKCSRAWRRSRNALATTNRNSIKR